MLRSALIIIFLLTGSFACFIPLIVSSYGQENQRYNQSQVQQQSVNDARLEERVIAMDRKIDDLKIVTAEKFDILNDRFDDVNRSINLTLGILGGMLFATLSGVIIIAMRDRKDKRDLSPSGHLAPPDSAVSLEIFRALARTNPEIKRVLEERHLL